MVVFVALVVWSGSSTAFAQPVGTFRWQQQPYCNVVTMNVVQTGGVYQLDGTDDQCGAATRASVVGLAFVNQNGTIGIGLTIVTTPGGTPLHLDATITLATVSGAWSDSTGATGAFVFTPGAPVAGSPRPVPRTSFPGGLSVGGTTITNVATPATATDAANKGYVDGIASTVRAAILADKGWAALVTSAGLKGSSGRYVSSSPATGRYSVTFDVIGLDIPSTGQQAVWTATPLCSGFTAAITFRSLSIGVGNVLNGFGVAVDTRNGADVLTNCSVSIQAMFPDPDAPDSPIPPLDAAIDAQTRTTSGDVTTCVAGAQD